MCTQTVICLWHLDMATLRVMAVFLLLLVGSLQNDNVADLIMDLQRYLHTGCVYLIGSVHEKWLLTRRLSSSWRQAGTIRIPSSWFFTCRHNKPLFVLLSADAHTLTNLRQVSGYRGVVSSASWLLQLPDNTSAHHVLRDVYVPINCLFLAAYSNGSIMDVYRVGPDTPLLDQQWATWTPGDGLVPSTDKSLLFRRQTLLGYSINATSMHEPPLVFMDEMHLQMIKGSIFGDVWNILENVINFSTRYEIPSEKTWGTFYSADNATGITGMLSGAKVEVAVFNMLMTAHRLDIMDFSIALLSPKYHVYIMRPEGSSLDWNIYLAPFSMKLWCVVVGLIVAISLYLPALHGLSRRHGVISDNGEPTFHVQQALFVIFGAFCMQGIEGGCPQVGACRIVYLTAYLTTVVLLASYAATLVSFLTIHTVKLPFTSLEEVLQDGSYALGMLGRSTILDYFKDPSEPYYRIWKTLIEPEQEENLVKSTSEGLKRVCTEKYAFMTNLNEMVVNMANMTCKVVSLPPAYFKSSLAFAFARNSSYRELFNYHLLNLRRRGILNKLEADLYRQLRLREAETVRESNKTWVSVSLGQLTQVLLALVGGMVLGVTLLLLERGLRERQVDKMQQSGTSHI